jgi:ABC-type uncharacterized transport system ATPase subunit
MSEQKAISTSVLTKKFGDFTAVNGISFEVNQGEIFGFLGAIQGEKRLVPLVGEFYQKIFKSL